MPDFFILHNSVVIPDKWFAGAGYACSIGKLANGGLRDGEWFSLDRGKYAC
jgi:hypothetical protein